MEKQHNDQVITMLYVNILQILWYSTLVISVNMMKRESDILHFSLSTALLVCWYCNSTTYRITILTWKLLMQARNCEESIVTTTGCWTLEIQISTTIISNTHMLYSHTRWYTYHTIHIHYTTHTVGTYTHQNSWTTHFHKYSFRYPIIVRLIALIHFNTRINDHNYMKC